MYGRPLQRFHFRPSDQHDFNYEIKDKIKIIQGKPLAVAVADSEVEIGIQQTNVIQSVAGTQYLGPLPPDLIEYGHLGVAVRNVCRRIRMRLAN
jgi:hypothetical protein